MSTNRRVATRLGGGDVAALARGNRRLEPRAPGGERLAGFRELPQHLEILMLAEPLAQPLRLRDPHLGEPLPQRLHDLHLVAMDDDQLAQFVQGVGAGFRPALRNGAPRRAIARRQLLGDVGELERLDRPAVDGDLRIGERLRDPQPHVRGQRILFAGCAQFVDALAHVFDRTLRQRQVVLLEIVERIERGLQIARAGEIARDVARRGLQAFGFRSQERIEQPQQRTPMLHLAAKLVHRDGVGIVGTFNRRARIRQDGARDLA